MAAMPPFTVEVIAPESGWPDRYHFSIERPTPGQRHAGLTMNLRGFVVPKDDLTPLPKSLALAVRGVVLWRSEVNLSRPDLASGELREQAIRAQFACGFDTMLPSFLSVREDPVVLCVEVEDAHGQQDLIPLAAIRMTGAPPRPLRGSPRVLTVNSMGRSGSSLLCRMLAAHPGFMVPRLGGQYGEVFLLGHLARLVAALGSEGALSWVNRMQQEPDFAVQGPGYFGIDGREGHDDLTLQSALLARLVECAQTAFDSVLAVVQRHIDEHKPTATWWVEKSWSSSAAPLLGVFSAEWREVILVRRPADFVRSQSLFLGKVDVPREDRLRHLRSTAFKLSKFCASVLDRGEFACVVRYEDLVADPAVTLQRVLRHAGFEHSLEDLDGMCGLVESDIRFREMLASPAPGRISGENRQTLLSIEPSSLGAEFRAFCEAFNYDADEALDVVW